MKASKKALRTIQDARNSLSDLTYLRDQLVKPADLVKMDHIWQTAKERLQNLDTLLAKRRR